VLLPKKGQRVFSIIITCFLGNLAEELEEYQVPEQAEVQNQIPASDSAPVI